MLFLHQIHVNCQHQQAHQDNPQTIEEVLRYLQWRSSICRHVCAQKEGAQHWKAHEWNFPKRSQFQAKKKEYFIKDWEHCQKECRNGRILCESRKIEFWRGASWWQKFHFLLIQCLILKAFTQNTYQLQSMVNLFPKIYNIIQRYARLWHHCHSPFLWDNLTLSPRPQHHILLYFCLPAFGNFLFLFGSCKVRW